MTTSDEVYQSILGSLKSAADTRMAREEVTPNVQKIVFSFLDEFARQAAMGVLGLFPEVFDKETRSSIVARLTDNVGAAMRLDLIDFLDIIIALRGDNPPYDDAVVKRRKTLARKIENIFAIGVV